MAELGEVMLGESDGLPECFHSGIQMNIIQHQPSLIPARDKEVEERFFVNPIVLGIKVDEWRGKDSVRVYLVGYPLFEGSVRPLFLNGAIKGAQIEVIPYNGICFVVAQSETSPSVMHPYLYQCLVSKQGGEIGKQLIRGYAGLIKEEEVVFGWNESRERRKVNLGDVLSGEGDRMVHHTMVNFAVILLMFSQGSRRQKWQ